MPDLGSAKTTLKAAAGYGAAVVLCCTLLAWVMNLWAADLSVPLCHLFLASYYLIPPTILVMLWVYQGRRILFHRDDATGRLRFRLLGVEPLAALVICGLVACAGIYYAAFACFFLLVTGLYTAGL